MVEDEYPYELGPYYVGERVSQKKVSYWGIFAGTVAGVAISYLSMALFGKKDRQT